VFVCVATAFLGSMMRTLNVSKRYDDLKIILNRITLSPNGGNHASQHPEGAWGPGRVLQIRA